MFIEKTLAHQHYSKGKSSVDVLNMSVEDACKFLNDNKKIIIE